jgi:hypothetical protein
MSLQIKLQLYSLIESKCSFKLFLSTYSAKFTDENKKVIKKFMTEKRSNQVFLYSNMLKNELDNSKVKIEIVERYLLQYFSFSKSFLETSNLIIPKIINIDLKSAYINVLKNEGLISENLFNEINKLKKMDRLVALGMLAHEPDVFTYKNGSLIDYEKIKNHYANYFYFAVKRVHEIICNCKFLIGDEFIFSWVDGFYFLENPKKESRIIEYLNNIGYTYTREILTDFTSNFKNGVAEITFKKGKDKKIFNIPTHCNDKKIMDALIIKNKILKKYDYKIK